MKFSRVTHRKDLEARLIDRDRRGEVNTVEYRTKTAHYCGKDTVRMSQILEVLDRILHREITPHRHLKKKTFEHATLQQYHREVGLDRVPVVVEAMVFENPTATMTTETMIKGPPIIRTQTEVKAIHTKIPKAETIMNQIVPILEVFGTSEVELMMIMLQETITAPMMTIETRILELIMILSVINFPTIFIETTSNSNWARKITSKLWQTAVLARKDGIDR